MANGSEQTLNEKQTKLCLVCSSGGHFYQMQQLKPWWGKHKHFWVSFDTPDVKAGAIDEKIHFGYFPENRNIVNAFRNLILAFKILHREKPNIIFSTGAGIAPPFFLVGKLMGTKLVYLETASYIGMPTLSGRMIHFIADVFLVQHKSSKKFYKKSQYKGALI